MIRKTSITQWFPAALALTVASSLLADTVHVGGPPRPGHARPPLHINLTPSVSTSYTPAQIRHAYGFDQLAASGANQKIAIVDAYGNAHIQSDLDTFCSQFGLSSTTVQILGNNTGSDAGWALETALDVEWAHAIAPGAKIVLVVATDRASLDEAINYAVVHHLGNTISNSWSSVEALGNRAQFIRVNRILEMAAAQGIDVNFATGDFGDESPVIGQASVDFPASSPFATGVGGTSLALNPDNTTGVGTPNGVNFVNAITQ